MFGKELVLANCGDGEDTIGNYTEVYDPNWDAEQEEIQRAALLRYVNEKTGKNYSDLGDAVVDFINN